MEQKIIKVGSSIAVVIPKPLAEENGFSAGNMVTIITREGSNQIIIEPSQIQRKPDVDPDILSWTNNFIDKNRELLKRLADK